MQGRVNRAVSIVAVVALITVGVFAQPKATPRTLYYDSDGNAISDKEFVDIRMANSHYPDATLVKTLPDGSTEFRLQKVPQEGMSAPEFVVRTMDGERVSLADLRGKVVVLNFWFIGCPACRAIKPHLNNFKTKFAESDVVFLAMTADASHDVERFLKKEPFDYLHAADAKEAMSKFVPGPYPKNIVIDRSGTIVYWRGPIKAWDKFESVVRTELARTNKPQR